MSTAQRPQWEIDAIDQADDARDARRAWANLTGALIKLARAAHALVLGLHVPRVKKGRGQRRNRRNRR